MRSLLAMAFTLPSCAPRAPDRAVPSLAPTVAAAEASTAIDAAVDASDASDASEASTKRSVILTRCGPDPERAPSADAYPPRRRLVSAAERAAVEARFRADSASTTWRTITVSPLGFMAYANADQRFERREPERDAAAAYFGRHAALFGISPGLRPLIADCADDKTYAGVRFLQYWGPHVAATLMFANDGATLVGLFLGELLPPPSELDDRRLVASLVGRRVTVKSTVSSMHPDPPGRVSLPTEHAESHVLTERDFRVTRQVQGLRSPSDPSVAELRIVAFIDVAIDGAGLANGVAYARRSADLETTHEATFTAPAPKLPLRLDAVTGESLDKREVVYPLPPH